jgi:2-phospho-L-lactate guanylyltransferase (CobY/MobA/RfbA family)
VIATDQHQDGTNALLMRPPLLFNYAYGPGSYQRHMQQAKDAGAEVQLYASERINFDIDLPQDWQQYQARVQRGELPNLLETT